MSIETPESLYASVDREGLTKIISNLLTNAIKYSETYIRIRLYSEGERLLLSVCNDGLVIPVEMREEIFKPFIQYKTGTLRSVPGTGIGLALARSLAELHEGTLCMEDSMENNCFLLSLPLKHEQTVAMEHKEPVTGGEPSEESGTGTALEQHRYTLFGGGRQSGNAGICCETALFGISCADCREWGGSFEGVEGTYCKSCHFRHYDARDGWIGYLHPKANNL